MDIANSNMRIINNEQNQHHYTDFSVLLAIAHSFLYCYSWSIFSIHLFSQTYSTKKMSFVLSYNYRFRILQRNNSIFYSMKFVSILKMPKKVYKSKSALLHCCNSYSNIELSLLWFLAALLLECYTIFVIFVISNHVYNAHIHLNTNP